VKRLAQTILLLLLLTIAAVLLVRLLPQHVDDGFESEGLSRLRWSRYRFAPGAVVSEDRVVRAGRRALAITVHSGDRFEQGVDGSASTERAELMEAWWLFARTGRTYSYSFSLYFPEDFPQTSERLVVAQWKQVCLRSKCTPDRPIVAIRYESGRLQVTRQNQEEKVVLYQGDKEVRGRWLDFRFVTKLDSRPDGKIEGWLNGTKIVSYNGPTMFEPARGYPRNGLVYFKMGLYRDALHEPPWTIYVDEYRKDQL